MQQTEKKIMAEIILKCDSIDLSFDNKNTPICENAQGDNAWISTDATILNEIFPPLDVSAGVALSVAIISVWGFAWGLSMIIAAVMRTRYS